MDKLVIFDCDGTLIDSEIIAARVFPTVWSSMGLQMTSDFFLCNFVGTGFNAEIVKQTMAQLPSNAVEIAEKKFEEEMANYLEPVKGIRQILEWLPHQACVASNSSLNYIKKALVKSRLDHFFADRVYSSREFGNPKPAPDIFLHAAKESGALPENCIVIEDSVSGIKGAQNAGMTVIGLMAGQHFNQVVKDRLLSAKANFYCSSAEELKEVIQNLF
ncbi:MAG: HAD family hydrolase [Bdellovibrionales bacterium]